MIHLAGLTRLEVLSLRGRRRVTNAGLEQLAGLRELRVLVLERTGVSSGWLDRLRGLPKPELSAHLGPEVVAARFTVPADFDAYLRLMGSGDGNAG